MNYSNLQKEVVQLLEYSSLSINKKLKGRARANAELIEETIQEGLSYKFSPASTARAMGDMSYECDGNKYFIDIKAHHKGKWGMPNITSYKRLRNFYEEESNYFVVMTIDYDIDDDGKFSFQKVTVEPIEHFSWGCLAVQGTLGQIQIKNADNIVIDKDVSRKSWVQQFYQITLNAIKKKQASLDKDAILFGASSSMDRASAF